MKRWATGHAVDLAAFRITVCAVVLLSADVWQARHHARDAGLAPEGWRLISSLLPPSPAAAKVVTALTLAGALLTLVGWHTRVFSKVTALCAAWLLGVPQHGGVVLHTHHLVWFLALLAVSPCGDALSIDARGAPRSAPSVAYGLPVRVAWVAVGLIFFFPGLWKLHAFGPWLEGLPRLAAWKTFQLGQAPWLQLPAPAWKVAGTLAVATELSIGPLLLFRRTRLAGVALALLFHLGVWALLRISFSSLWACYPVFVPWSRAEPVDGVPRARSWWPSAAVGLALVSAQVVTGLAGRDNTWPVACYPRFHGAAPRFVEWLEVTEETAGTARLVFSLEELRGNDGQRRWGHVMTALRNPDARSLARFHRRIRGEVPGNTTVRFERVRRDLTTGETVRTPLPAQ